MNCMDTSWKFSPRTLNTNYMLNKQSLQKIVKSNRILSGVLDNQLYINMLTSKN